MVAFCVKKNDDKRLSDSSRVTLSVLWNPGPRALPSGKKAGRAAEGEGWTGGVPCQGELS